MACEEPAIFIASSWLSSLRQLRQEENQGRETKLGFLIQRRKLRKDGAEDKPILYCNNSSARGLLARALPKATPGDITFEQTLFSPGDHGVAIFAAGHGGQFA